MMVYSEGEEPRRSPPKCMGILSNSDEVLWNRTGTPSHTREEIYSPRTTNLPPLPSTANVKSKADDKDDDDDDELLSSYFANFIPKVRLPRKMHMKNQFGTLVIKTPAYKRKIKEQDYPPSPTFKKIPADVSETVFVTCKYARVGSLCRQTTQQVVISPEYIHIDDQILLSTSTLTSSYRCHDERLPCLFLKTTRTECHRLGILLKMSRLDPIKGEWYDSMGPNLDENYIVLVFRNILAEVDKALLDNILASIGQVNNVAEFNNNLTFKEANCILNHSSKAKGGETTNQNWNIMGSTQAPASHHPGLFQDQFMHTVFHATAQKRAPVAVSDLSQGRSHQLPVEDSAKVPRVPTGQSLKAPPAQHPSDLFLSGANDGDSVEVQLRLTESARRLIIYPLPPARGITVTNEDLQCLNHGEFLNDVIIDFYLKFLLLARLKEQDATRTYVFSSFFFKRLTQVKQRHHSGLDILPTAKQRHSQVKTWTRHVDLFQKDFIFVPINKKSHWFLAVICFPALGDAYHFDKELAHPSPQSLSTPLPRPQALSPDRLPTYRHQECLSPELVLRQQQQPQGQIRPCLVIPRPHFPEEDLSPVSTKTQSHTDQGFVPHNMLVPSHNPMSLFFSPMEGVAREDDNRYPSLDADVSAGRKDGCKGVDSEEEIKAFKYGLPLNQEELEGSFEMDSQPTPCKKPCIIIMDSLGSNVRSSIVQTLREYLEVEWEVKRGTKKVFTTSTMRGYNPSVPQQDNFSDCGVFLLQYVESFFQHPLPSFEPPFDLENWFPLQQVKSKREEIRHLILTLHQQQKMESHVVM